MVEHRQHRVHAQSCLRVGVFTVTHGMGISVGAGCQELQLLHRSWRVSALFCNDLLQLCAPCTPAARNMPCFAVLLYAGSHWTVLSEQWQRVCIVCNQLTQFMLHKQGLHVLHWVQTMNTALSSQVSGDRVMC